MLIILTCKNCRKNRAEVVDRAPWGQAVPAAPCAACGGEVERTPAGSSAHLVERIDDGLHDRAVEVPGRLAEMNEADRRRPAPAPPGRLWRSRGRG